MTTKKPNKRRRDEVHGSSYQPSKAELEEPIKAPDDLMELPMPERLEEAARRLLQDVPGVRLR